jgi:hypothetical protein
MVSANLDSKNSKNLMKTQVLSTWVLVSLGFLMVLFVFQWFSMVLLSRSMVLLSNSKFCFANLWFC